MDERKFSVFPGELTASLRKNKTVKYRNNYLRNYGS